MSERLTTANIAASVACLRKYGRAPSEDPSSGYSSPEKAIQVKLAAQAEGLRARVRKLAGKREWAVHAPL